MNGVWSFTSKSFPTDFIDSPIATDVLAALSFYRRTAPFLSSTADFRVLLNRLPAIATNHADPNVKLAAMSAYKELCVVDMEEITGSNWADKPDKLAQYIVFTLSTQSINSINAFENILRLDTDVEVEFSKEIVDEVLALAGRCRKTELWRVFFALKLLSRRCNRVLFGRFNEMTGMVFDVIAECENEAEWFPVMIEFLQLLCKIWRPKRKPSDISPPPRLEWDHLLYKFMTYLVCLAVEHRPSEIPGYLQVAEAVCNFISCSCDKPNLLYHRIMCHIGGGMDVIKTQLGRDEANFRMLNVMQIPAMMALGYGEYLTTAYVDKLCLKHRDRISEKSAQDKIDKDVQIQAMLQFEQKTREQITDWLNLELVYGENQVFAQTRKVTDAIWKGNFLQWHGVNRRRSLHDIGIPLEHQMVFMRGILNSVTRYMMVSESYCLEQLPALSRLLKKGRFPEIRQLSISTMSDISVRHVNAIQNHFGSLFDALADPTPTVRYVAILSVIRLILNDLVKVKGKAGKFAHSLSDPNPVLSDMAKSFLLQYAQRSSVVKSFMPAIMKFLCEPDTRGVQIDRIKSATVMKAAASVLDNPKAVSQADVEIYLDFIIMHIPRVRLDETAAFLIETLTLYDKKLNPALMEKLLDNLKKRKTVLNYEDIREEVLRLCKVAVKSNPKSKVSTEAIKNLCAEIATNEATQTVLNVTQAWKTPSKRKIWTMDNEEEDDSDLHALSEFLNENLRFSNPFPQTQPLFPPPNSPPAYVPPIKPPSTSPSTSKTSNIPAKAAETECNSWKRLKKPKTINGRRFVRMLN